VGLFSRLLVPRGVRRAMHPGPDVFSARMAFLTSGKAGSGGLRPHDDLLAEFPFPGPPNP
jgi:hypothetical protein